MSLHSVGNNVWLGQSQHGTRVYRLRAYKGLITGRTFAHSGKLGKPNLLFSGAGWRRTEFFVWPKHAFLVPSGLAIRSWSTLCLRRFLLSIGFAPDAEERVFPGQRPEFLSRQAAVTCRNGNRTAASTFQPAFDHCNPGFHWKFLRRSVRRLRIGPCGDRVWN